MKLKKRDGFTLVETLISVAIATVIIISVMASALYAMRFSTLERAKTLAQDVARNIMSQQVRTVKWDTLIDKYEKLNGGTLPISGVGNSFTEVLYEKRTNTNLLTTSSLKQDLDKLNRAKCDLNLKMISSTQLDLKIKVSWDLAPDGSFNKQVSINPDGTTNSIVSRMVELSTIVSQGDFNLKRSDIIASPITPTSVPVTTIPTIACTECTSGTNCNTSINCFTGRTCNTTTGICGGFATCSDCTSSVTGCVNGCYSPALQVCNTTNGLCITQTACTETSCAATGQVCGTDGICACNDTSCGQGKKCNSVTLSCEENVSCTYASDCVTTKVCSSGICVNDCTNIVNGDCAIGLFCNTTSKVCEPEILKCNPYPCPTDHTCFAQNAACVDNCTLAAGKPKGCDCASDLVCSSGNCVGFTLTKLGKCGTK